MTSWLGRLFGRSESASSRAPRPRAAGPTGAPPRAARRSERVVARIPVTLKREGRVISAVTAVVNDEGGLVIAPADVPLGVQCVMQHYDTGRTARVRIVWNGGLDELGSYKLGVEFMDDAPGFWGDKVAPKA